MIAFKEWYDTEEIFSGTCKFVFSYRMHYNSRYMWKQNYDLIAPSPTISNWLLYKVTLKSSKFRRKVKFHAHTLLSVPNRFFTCSTHLYAYEQFTSFLSIIDKTMYYMFLWRETNVILQKLSFLPFSLFCRQLLPILHHNH